MSKWPLVKLSEVLRPVSRSEPVRADATYRLLGAHWYALGLYVKDVAPGSSIQAAKLYRVCEGDFVYNRLFAWKGSFALASQEDEGCFVSNEFPCFQIVPEKLDGIYLWRYFSRLSAWNEALGLSTGGTPTSRNRLKEEKLLAIKIPLPPIDEQRRIVASIEQVAAKLDAARKLREDASATTDRLLPTETTRLFEGLAHPTATLCSLGRDGANPIQTGPFGAQLHASDFVDSGIPVLNVGNVWPEGLRLANLDHVTEHKAASLTRYALEPDDLLFARSGATLGKVCLVPDDCRGWLMTGHLFRVRLDQARCDPRFVFAGLRSADSVRGQVFDLIRGATRPGFNTSLLSKVRIPLPPLAEQRQIVERLERYQARVGALKTAQAHVATQLDALLPAVLYRAFRGDL